MPGAMETLRAIDKVRAARRDLATSLGENRTNGIAILKEKIRSGTPIEKEAALCVLEYKVVLDLVPCLIDAVTDKTLQHDALIFVTGARFK